MTVKVAAPPAEPSLSWESVLQRNGFSRMNPLSNRWQRNNSEWHLTVQPTTLVDESNYWEVRCSYPRSPQGEFYLAECSDPTRFSYVLQQLWTRIALDHGGDPAMPGEIADAD